MAPCGFDTHYPDFLPMRKGYEHYLKMLQGLGMRVVPYTNGVLFDPDTTDWTPALA